MGKASSRSLTYFTNGLTSRKEVNMPDRILIGLPLEEI